MNNHQNFYIDGKWVAPAAPKLLDVIDPSTERVLIDTWRAEQFEAAP